MQWRFNRKGGNYHRCRLCRRWKKQKHLVTALELVQPRELLSSSGGRSSFKSIKHRWCWNQCQSVSQSVVACKQKLWCRSSVGSVHWHNVRILPPACLCVGLVCGQPEKQASTPKSRQQKKSKVYDGSGKEAKWRSGSTESVRQRLFFLFLLFSVSLPVCSVHF